MRLTVEGAAIARGGRELLRGVTFTLEGGEALVLRGPNGLGKSSLLAAVAGELRLASGRAVLIGAGDATPREASHLVAHRDAIRAALTPRETLAFQAAVLGGSGWHGSAASPGEALHRLGLSAAADLPCGHLSAGQRRRLALARLLVAPRPLWLLDEPATALDAEARGVLAGLCAEHLARGGLVLAAAHGPDDLPGATDLDLRRFQPALPALGDAAFLDEAA